MSTRTVNDVHAGAYYLHSPVSLLRVTATGTVEGNASYGVAALGATAAYTVVNAGQISGGGFGVFLTDGGSVSNAGSIGGAQGVLIKGAAGNMDNTSTITGSSFGAVLLEGGGALTNSGLLQGVSFAAEVTGGAGTIANSGAIVAGGDAFAFGVALEHGGMFTNGSSADAVATVTAANGVLVEGGRGTVVNFGQIAPGATAGSVGGVYLATGGVVTNEAGAEISGASGVVLGAAGTVTNFGTIAGAADSVDFLSAGATLIVEAGAVFLGQAWGGGGTLKFAGGSASLTTIAAGGALSLAQGTNPDATFTDFSTVEIAKGATLSLTGAGDVTVANLDVLGTLAVTGALTVQAAIAGTGTLALESGSASFEAGADLAVAKVAQSGGEADFNAKSLTVGALWTQTAGVVAAAAGDHVDFTGPGDRFAGTLAGAGTIAFTGGAVTFARATLSAKSVRIDGAAAALSGLTDLTGALTVTDSTVTVAAGGASLTGGGVLTLDGGTIVGASAGARLVNDGDHISGAGQLGDGQLAIRNEAGGVIDGSTSGTLVIDTGAAALLNDGLIENLAAGQTSITGAVENVGTLRVAAGTLSVGGDVSGDGSVRIVGGVADFTGVFSETVVFVGAGELVLAHSQAYKATIVSFSKTGADTLDLEDIAFGADTTATYSGKGVGGVLTVTDGTHTATLRLEGNYLSSSFALASDGHGGVLVTDPAASASAGALAAAMASFAPAPAAAAGSTPAEPSTHPLLATPAH